jgi:hypothetical protein
MIRHHAFGSPEWVERSSALAQPINGKTPQRSVSFRLPCLTSKLLDDYAVWFVNGQ